MFCQCQLVCWGHAQTPGPERAGRWCTAPPGRAAADPRPAAPPAGAAGLGRGVWACVLGFSAWRWARQDRPLASYPELCRLLAASGRARSASWTPQAPGRCCAATQTPGSRPRNGAATATAGPVPAAAPCVVGRCAGITARSPSTAGCCGSRWPGAARRCGCGLDRDLPCPAGLAASVTLLYDAGRLWGTPPLKCPSLPTRRARSRTRAGWPGWTWGSSTLTPSPGPARKGCWCSGAAIPPSTTSTTRTPRPAAGAPPAAPRNRAQRGSRRWRQHRRRQRLAEARHRRRVAQAQHEAAAMVGLPGRSSPGRHPSVGDPRGVLALQAGGGTTGAPATGASATSSAFSATKPRPPGSPSP